MPPTNQSIKRIVVGLDGSDQAAAALEWTISLARPLGAEIVAVYAVPLLAYLVDFYGMAPPIQYDPDWAAGMKREFTDNWCKPLRQSGLPHRLVMKDGRPAAVIADVADSLNADLVVVGRRGRGSVAEVLLGSVSHELSHHCKRPVLVISNQPTTSPRELAASAAKQA